MEFANGIRQLGVECFSLYFLNFPRDEGFDNVSHVPNVVSDPLQVNATSLRQVRSGFTDQVDLSQNQRISLQGDDPDAIAMNSLQVFDHLHGRGNRQQGIELANGPQRFLGRDLNPFSGVPGADNVCQRHGQSYQRHQHTAERRKVNPRQDRWVEQPRHRRAER